MSACGGRPAVLVMARAPRRGEVRRALEPLLGADTCLALQSLLIARTVAWAAEVADGAVHVAHDPPDAAAELRPLVGGAAGAVPTERRRDRGTTRRRRGAGVRAPPRPAADRLAGPAAAARLHAEAALDDLRGGCDVVLGPAIDGGMYLIGISRPLPGLFALPEQTWRSPDVMTVGVAAARDAGLEIGILRVERALHRPADVRAALADPLLPADIRQLIS